MSFFSGSSKRRKGFISDLNLIPFIDLLSALTLFLVATASMSQVAGLNLNLGIEDKPSLHTVPDTTQVKKVVSDIKILMMPDFIDLVEGRKVTRIPLTRNAVSQDNPNDEKKDVDTRPDLTNLDVFLENIRNTYLDKKDMLLLVSDASTYEDLTAVIDRCYKFAFEDVVVTGLEQGL